MSMKSTYFARRSGSASRSSRPRMAPAYTSTLRSPGLRMFGRLTRATTLSLAIQRSAGMSPNAHARYSNLR